MKEETIQSLVELYEQWSGDTVVDTRILPPSGSYREYCRLIGKKDIVMGVYNSDQKENRAFITFARHFHEKGLPVPEVFVEDIQKNIYLVKDLGDTTLFDYILQYRQGEGFPEDLKDIYKKVLQHLVQFQLKGGEQLDFDVCYPRASFDKQSMIWDLHYFKYYFLKLAKIPFDEQLLEDDFQQFSDYLLKSPMDFFLYRDFQSRNVMLQNNEPWFIDFQGGRKGALQYDLASLLFDAKADLPQEVRDELLDFYIQELKEHMEVDEDNFTAFYCGFVLIRIMQAMGAYGFRGFYERKKHFLQSIPYALKNLKIILRRWNLPLALPELRNALEAVIESPMLKNIGQEEVEKLNIEVNSFSYRRGVPLDKSKNGGGFVFDCRGIHNPGRYEEYMALTGKDIAVAEFFKEKSQMDEFLKGVTGVVDLTVDNYIDRNFTNLQINFGCTGGRHRSVFAAEHMAHHLQDKYDVNVTLRHIEREIEGN